jgi:hypothetical protein
MPRLSRKTKLIREVARSAAEEMAAEGDRSILDAAEKLAGEVNQVSVDGALEVLLCAALHEMRYNGQAADVAPVEEALDRYNEEASDD